MASLSCGGPKGGYPSAGSDRVAIDRQAKLRFARMYSIDWLRDLKDQLALEKRQRA
jgi:hypothetical protein